MTQKPLTPPPADKMVNGKTVLVVADVIGATQRISFEQPFSEDHFLFPVHVVFLRRIKDKTSIQAAFKKIQPAILILSRYTADDGRYWISLARQAGIAVIFHIDDDLLAVPLSLGKAKYDIYNAPERLRALRNNIESCDLLYTSTGPLAERMKSHGIQTPIFAGSVYCSVNTEEDDPLLPPATGPVIGYMGTGGHSDDLAMILPAVARLMERIPALQFELFGTIDMPQGLERFGNRVRHIPPVRNYDEFVELLRSLGWWVGIAPLEDNTFNRCKADTKWVEYSHAGMAVVASDLPVYHRACADGAGILATSEDDWFVAMHALVVDAEHRQNMVLAAQEKLRSTYSHTPLRAQVLRAFDQAYALI